jgi:hypothetical protein
LKKEEKGEGKRRGPSYLAANRKSQIKTKVTIFAWAQEATNRLRLLILIASLSLVQVYRNRWCLCLFVTHPWNESNSKTGYLISTMTAPDPADTADPTAGRIPPSNCSRHGAHAFPFKVRAPHFNNETTIRMSRRGDFFIRMRHLCIFL